MTKSFTPILLAFLFLILTIPTRAADPPAKSKLTVYLADASPRAAFGANKLISALNAIGYKTKLKTGRVSSGKKNSILLSSDSIQGDTLRKEGFEIISGANNNWSIRGKDASGILYGCMELASRIQQSNELPNEVSFSDQPQMVLRGACIGIQKPSYLPGRHVYEYPYTPETFPWFYNKQLWIQYLDTLVANRMNSLYLWNGHPFASLVKLKDYPYAVEVSDETFAKNQEMFRFLTTEADKRGIWVIQMFYNIIVSKPFAEHHNIKTQDRNRPIIPLIADYTRKSIAAFVSQYPNVGLMMALGEAMEGVGEDDIEWFTKTIIPGVKDGLKILGTDKEPPIVLRAHDTDAPAVMEAALPLYKNLYTEAKFNGEALTTYEPRGPWAELHRKLSSLGSVQIENVHILANLEPFRYGSADFIQKSVLAMHNIYHANGLHLYPESSYWDWPYSADKTNPRLLQIERDWVWYKAWARYAWKADRDRDKEIIFWSEQLAGKFNSTEGAGRLVLESYEQAGEIAPKILRRFGITDGNRQTMTLGMLMTQLINPYRYGLFTLLYDSESPEGEMLTEYAEKDWKGQPHIGETPVQIIEQIRDHGNKAVLTINRAARSVKGDTAEFNRIVNDMKAYQLMAESYASKAEAALKILRYKYSNDLKDLEDATPLLKRSLDAYSQLADLTDRTYLYANSMQTSQRKIPVSGVDGTMKTWRELLPVYQEEYRIFLHKLDSLHHPDPGGAKGFTALAPADVRLMDQGLQRYSISTGSHPFADTNTYIKDYANELSKLQGVALNKAQQLVSGTRLEFESATPVKVLVGFFNDPNPRFSPKPQLEIDATANDRGQAEARIANGLLVSGMPAVNVHSYSFPKGKSILVLPKGAALILGIVNDSNPLKPRDAGLTPGGVKKELDWLFE